MLRSTLRRMTRLAVSNPEKQPSPPTHHLQLPATPSPVRGASPKQAEASSPIPSPRKPVGVAQKTVSPAAATTAFGSSIQRSRSFRDAVGYGSSDTLGRSSQYGPSSISSVQLNYRYLKSMRFHQR